MSVPPITTYAKWKAANDAVKGRSQSKGHGSRGPAIKALLRPVCVCGGPMYRYAGWNGNAIYRCAGLGVSGTSALRKGCGNTIPLALLDQEVTGEFENEDGVHLVETRIPGSDHAEEIARVSLAIRDLDPKATITTTDTRPSARS